MTSMTPQEKKKVKIRIILLSIVAVAILAIVFLRLIIVEPNTQNIRGATQVQMELKAN